MAANPGAERPGRRRGSLFEIEDFSFDTEQTLNIGSQSTGAGAGKITFNPFSITRKIDRFFADLVSELLFWDRLSTGRAWIAEVRRGW